MRYWISLVIAVFATSSFSEEKTTLYDFRYWTAPDQTRIVIDKEEDTLFNITNTDKVVIISFDDAEVLSETFSNIFLMMTEYKKFLLRETRELLS